MIEAVGWRVLADLLRDHRPGSASRRPGGIQAITMPHDRMLATRRHLHLDQQVHLPRRLPALGPGRSTSISRQHTALRLTDRLSMGLHYAQTLRLWDEAFPRPPSTCSTSASTRPSCGCGTSTWSTPGPASPRGYLDVNQLVFTTAGLDGHRDPRPHAAAPPTAGSGVAPRLGSPSARAAPSAATCRCACGPGTAREAGPPDGPARGAALPRRRAPAAVAPRRARRRPGLRHRRARRPGGRRLEPRPGAHPCLRGRTRPGTERAAPTSRRC